MDGKIIVLEPRRLAARAAAERMAKTLGEQVGQTVGLRVRFGSKVSRATRVEVVTEGIFTRLILDDPGIDRVSRRCCSTNFMNVRSTPISAWHWRATRNKACARISSFW